MRSGFISVALLASVAACGGRSSAGDLTAGDLPAGSYATTVFEPRVNLELPAGWASRHEGEAFFDVHRPLSEPARRGPIWDVAILVARLDPRDTPGDVVDRLEETPGLELGPVAAAELDGAEGLRVDVEAASESPVVSFEGGSISAFPGRKLRVYAVDVDATPVVLVVDAPAETFAQGVEAAQPVLDSVELG